MKNIAIEPSEVILDPKVWALMAQIVATLPLPPPPTKPPKMEATM